MPGPLEGFKVLDLSAVVSGPLTGALLADQGADIIKVERLTGDIQRHVGSKRNGFSGFFHILNRGKRSIALDLGTDDGRDIVLRLAQDADAVIQNFRPGVADRLGVGYQALSSVNAGIVYLSISGFGQTGPRAGERAYDPIIQLYSGIAAVQGRIHREHPDMPEQVNQLILDKMTAHKGAQAITAGLLARTRTGKGQHVELSMLDTAISFMWSDAAADLILQDDDNVEHRPPVGASGNVAEYSDGWGATMTLTDAEFQGMCRAYGLEQIAEDPRFATLEARMNNRLAFADEVRTQVAEAARQLSLDDVTERFRNEDVPFAYSRALDELFEDEQIVHNKMFRIVDHPVAGKLREARAAALFRGTPVAVCDPAPTIGQHTREILTEAGLADRIDDLLRRGIVTS